MVHFSLKVMIGNWNVKNGKTDKPPLPPSGQMFITPVWKSKKLRRMDAGFKIQHGRIPIDLAISAAILPTLAMLNLRIFVFVPNFQAWGWVFI